MKASEKILLVVTIGLGVTLGVAHVGGMGRQAKQASAPSAGEPAGKTPATPSSRSTLELLASKGAALRPLPVGARNPFRPVASARGAQWLVVGIKVTGILGEREPLTAFVTGQLVGAGDSVDGLTLLRVASGESAVEPLLRGVHVRGGQRVGGLRIVRVTRSGVGFEYAGEPFFVKLFNRAAHPAGGGASNDGASGTESSAR